jgi:hypothetical protein
MISERLSRPAPWKTGRSIRHVAVDELRSGPGHDDPAAPTRTRPRMFPPHDSRQRGCQHDPDTTPNTTGNTVGGIRPYARARIARSPARARAARTWALVKLDVKVHPAGMLPGAHADRRRQLRRPLRPDPDRREEEAPVLGNVGIGFHDHALVLARGAEGLECRAARQGKHRELEARRHPGEGAAPQPLAQHARLHDRQHSPLTLPGDTPRGMVGQRLRT